MTAVKVMAIAAVALVATPASAEECRPFGYITCSFTGWCLNWCNKWEPPQNADPGLSRDLIFNPVLKFNEITRHWALPPLKYDYEYTGKLMLQRGTLAQVTAWCMREFPVLGCAARRFSGNECDVWIVNDDVLEQRRLAWDIIWRHEQGHCNGWKHTDDSRDIFKPNPEYQR